MGASIKLIVWEIYGQSIFYANDVFVSKSPDVAFSWIEKTIFLRGLIRKQRSALRVDTGQMATKVTCKLTSWGC